MKEEINLIPSQAAAMRVRRIYLQRFGSLLRYIIVLLILFCLVMGGLYGVLRFEAQRMIQVSEVTGPEQQALLAQAARINEQFLEIRAWGNTQQTWTSLLPDVFDQLPQGVRLTELDVAAETGQLTLRGTFVNRESLLLFQRQLEALPWVVHVEAPLSNFATGEDARFELIITRKATL